MQPPPQVQQIQQQAADLQVQIESRKATLIAEFMDDYAKQKKKF